MYSGWQLTCPLLYHIILCTTIQQPRTASDTRITSFIIQLKEGSRRPAPTLFNGIIRIMSIHSSLLILTSIVRCHCDREFSSFYAPATQNDLGDDNNFTPLKLQPGCH